MQATLPTLDFVRSEASRKPALPATIRVFRARSGEPLTDARRRRAEVVTLDTQDLVRVLTRCQTTLHASEVASVVDAVSVIPPGAAADILLSPGARVLVEVRANGSSTSTVR